jgi:hypothetical protein
VAGWQAKLAKKALPKQTRKKKQQHPPPPHADSSDPFDETGEAEDQEENEQECQQNRGHGDVNNGLEEDVVVDEVRNTAVLAVTLSPEQVLQLVTI